MRASETDIEGKVKDEVLLLERSTHFDRLASCMYASLHILLDELN